MAPRPDLAAPPCRDALAAALTEVDALRSRLVTAEADAATQRDRAARARAASEAAAAGVALGRITDAEADSFDAEAGAAAKAVRRSERLLVGLRKVLADAEAAAAGMAEDADAELRAWALAQVLDR